MVSMAETWAQLNSDLHHISRKGDCRFSRVISCNAPSLPSLEGTLTRVRVLGLSFTQPPGPSQELASCLLHPLFSSIHPFNQFLLLSSLTPSCCRTIPLVLLGLQGDREQLASIWCSPLARAPAPWAFRSPGRIILFPLTFGLGPMLPGFHHGQCASEATPGVPGPPMPWLGQARLASRSGAGVSDLSPLLTRAGAGQERAAMPQERGQMRGQAPPQPR